LPQGQICGAPGGPNGKPKRSFIIITSRLRGLHLSQPVHFLSYRYIMRQADEAVMDANHQRVVAHPEIVAERKTSSNMSLGHCVVGP